MNKKILNNCIAATLLGLASVNSQAASIWLEPVSQDINVNGVAPLSLWADASDVGGFLAGGLDLFYDISILRYNGDFAFDPWFPTDPFFSRPGETGDPDDCSIVAADGCSVPGEINGIAFGSFTGLAASGPTLVGTLSFTGMELGTSLLTMTDNDTPAGAWFATDASGPLDVAYGSAEVNVVPIPAAAWLFGTGLLALTGVARRRKAA